MKVTIRSVLVGAAAVCVAILTSARADGLNDFLQKFSPSDPCDWSGFYGGFNNGAGFTDFHTGKHMTDVNITDQFYSLSPVFFGEEDFFATFDVPGHHHTDTETIGGAQTGFNFQFGHFVIGGEGSFLGNGSKSDSKFNEFQENSVFLQTLQRGVVADTDFTARQKLETTWNAFVGGHLGFAWNRFLFYGGGGAAFTDLQFESSDKADTSFFSNVCIGDCVSDIREVAGPHQGEFFFGEAVNTKKHSQRDILTGWYGGGGISFALTDIVSIGVDYKHTDWGDVTEHLSGPKGPVFPTNENVSLTGDEVVFQVNILLGRLHPFH